MQVIEHWKANNFLAVFHFDYSQIVRLNRDLLLLFAFLLICTTFNVLASVEVQKDLRVVKRQHHEAINFINHHLRLVSHDLVSEDFIDRLAGVFFKVLVLIGELIFISLVAYICLV